MRLLEENASRPCTRRQTIGLNRKKVADLPCQELEEAGGGTKQAETE
jgi:hypothetical protein